MRDILSDIERWRAEGRPIAVATVVETWGSRRARRRKDGGQRGRSISGSVSGGCVENAVVEVGAEDAPPRVPQLLHFGISDDTAWSVGLACGGTIEIFVEPLGDREIFDPVREALLQGSVPPPFATVIRGRTPTSDAKLALFADGTHRARRAGRGDTRRGARGPGGRGEPARLARETGSSSSTCFFPSPRMVIVGGVHVAISARLAREDSRIPDDRRRPRASFANAKRFPHADEIVSEWPDAALGNLGVELLHGHRRADPRPEARRSGADGCPVAALAFYVGALGSRPGRTKAPRAAPRRGSGREEGKARRASMPPSACPSAAARPRRSPCRSSPRSSRCGTARSREFAARNGVAAGTAARASAAS